MRTNSLSMVTVFSASFLFTALSPSEEIPDVSAWLELDEEPANTDEAWDEEQTEIIPALAAHLHAAFWEAETESMHLNEEVEARFAA